jgi:hypothetical protein
MDIQPGVSGALWRENWPVTVKTNAMRFLTIFWACLANSFCARLAAQEAHQATISMAVLDSVGKLVMETILETSSPCPMCLSFTCDLCIGCGQRDTNSDSRTVRGLRFDHNVSPDQPQPLAHAD